MFDKPDVWIEGFRLEYLASLDERLQGAADAFDLGACDPIDFIVFFNLEHLFRQDKDVAYGDVLEGGQDALLDFAEAATDEDPPFKRWR